MSWSKFVEFKAYSDVCGLRSIILAPFT
jgi:hypothetical protein